MGFIYLDNAATAFPKSEGVLQAVIRAFTQCGNGGRGGHALSMKATETVFACRVALADLFGAEPEGVVLTCGATAALNMAIKGLAPERGGVLCSTLEHNAVLRPLYTLKGVRLDFFAPSFSSQRQSLENALSAIKEDTALAVITAASNVCGIRLPVKEICAECRRRGIVTVLDCAQTAGHISVDIRELGADLICIPGHKGLGGPAGVGALIVNPQSHLRFRTLIEGGTGEAARDRYMPPSLPERLEAGSCNVLGIAGLAAACGEAVPDGERGEELRAMTVKGLEAIEGVRVYGAHSDGGYAPVVAFNIRSIPSDKAAALLEEKGLLLRGGLHCAPLAHAALGTGRYGCLRASFGRNNGEADVGALLGAVSAVAKAGG